MKKLLGTILLLLIALGTPIEAQVHEFGLGETARKGPSPGPPPSPETIQENARKLSLQARVSQLMVVTLQGGPMPDSSDKALLTQYPPGGVILPPVMRPSTVPGYIAAVRALSAGPSKGIPLLIGSDLHALPRQSNRETMGRFAQLPSLLSIGATGDQTIADRYARLVGEQLKIMGFNFFLGPPLSLGPVLPEARGSLACLGDDPAFVGAAGAGIVTTLKSMGIVAMPMGFPGGGHNRGAQQSAVLLTPGPHVAARDMAPFAQTIHAGALILHVGNTLAPTLDSSGIPASLSQTVIKGHLRDKLGFTGVILAGPIDSTEVGNVQDPSQAAMRALEAGADMLSWNTAGQRVKKTVDLIVNAINNGEFDESIINAALERIVTMKTTHLLAPAPTATERKAETLEKSKRFPNETRAIEQRAITIVRNADNLLPLTKTASLPIGVTGIAGATELKEALEKRLRRVSLQTIATARHLGEIEDFEIKRLTQRGAGLRTVVCVLAPGLKNRSNERLVKGLQAAGMKVIVVLLGYPRELHTLADADAIVLSYGDPASCDQTMLAVADVLVGTAPIAAIAPPPAPVVSAGQPCVFDVRHFLRSPAGRLPVAAGDDFPAGSGLVYALEPLIKKAAWDFGDGERAKQARVEHVYAAPGTYSVTLTVSGRNGKTTNAQATITVH